jgi:predicted TIM-barrel fold metal-dependent hydrolase
MGRRYQVISADGHVEVPIDTWRHRVPEKHHDSLPRLVHHEDGSEKWCIEFGGQYWERNTSGNVVGDRDYDEFVPTAPKYFRPDGSRMPGTGDAVQRLQEQDLDGIDAEILYPPVYSPIFWSHGVKDLDPDAHRAFVRGYNDWLAEEYCAVAPDRLIGMAILPETGIDDALAEMTHIKEQGLRAVTLAKWPNGGPFYSAEDDRFFAASLDLGVKLAPHENFGEMKPRRPGAAGLDRDSMLAASGFGRGACEYPIGQLIVNGVFDRFPDLKVYFAETQAGWLAHALNWTDGFYRNWSSFVDLDLPRMPSEYYRDHCRFSFIVDRMAMLLRNYIGIDMLLFGTDFPHSVSTFPYTREWIDDLFEGVPEDERRQVLVGNACEFFDLDPTAELTPTPERAAAVSG